MSSTTAGTVPPSRIRPLNRGPIRRDAAYVLYWMVAARRSHDNFALDRALQHCRELGLPLLVFEPLRVAYPHASDRLHRFVLDGMADNAARFANSPVGYFPYVEAAPGEGGGLLERLARDAAVIVTDLYPTFFIPRMQSAAAERLPVLLEEVDSYGLLPIRATERAFTTAASFRRYAQKNALRHLRSFPRADPLRGLSIPNLAGLDQSVTDRWPAAGGLLEGGSLARLPIDHTVPEVGVRGGSREAARRFRGFLDERFERYPARNHPDDDIQSGASFWLHFGHLSPHRMFRDIARREGFALETLEGKKATGSRERWWGMSEAAEAFLDQLLTWREIGANLAAVEPAHRRYESLPAWARETLAVHADDPRPVIYSMEALEAADTGDEIWNAAQRELLRSGRIHNYLRMLWGKRILEWSKTPEQALETMIQLNDKWAVDGRDPNSYSGIFWVLGRYDRAWGPERPIFGKVRYMSSAATRKKLRLRSYLARFGATPQLELEKDP